MRLYALLAVCCVLLFGCSNIFNNNAILNKELQDNSNQQIAEPQTQNANYQSSIEEQDIVEPSKITASIEPVSMDQQVGNPQEIERTDEQSPLQSQVENQSSQVTIEEYIQYDFQNPELIDGPKIYFLALGDSLTRGVGDEEKKNGYTKRLVEKIETTNQVSHVYLDNRGKRGRRSDQLLSLIKKGHYDNELKNSNLITITIGGNDIMKVVKQHLFELKKDDFDQELVEFQYRYDQIIKEIRLRNMDVPIIIIGLYNPFSLITEEVSEFEMIMKEWNNSMKDLSEKHVNACFVEVEDLFEDNAQLVYHTDFFHPNGYGYTMMTDRIITKMQNCEMEEKTKGLILFSQISLAE